MLNLTSFKNKSASCIICLMLCMSLSSVAYSSSIVGMIGYGYCNLSHPVEAFVIPIKDSATCEQQHIIQQQHGGSDWGNISIIPTSSHITTDTWGGSGVVGQDRVWDYSEDYDFFGTTKDAEKALDQAYKLGRYQLEYTYILYDYNKDEWDTTVLNWDGMSNLTYMVTWWVNLPSKYLRKLAYLIDKGRYSLIIDHALQLPILIVEGSVGVVYNGIGVVTGFIFQPMDSLNAFLGSIWLICKGILLGVRDLFLTCFLIIKAIL